MAAPVFQGRRAFRLFRVPIPPSSVLFTLRLLRAHAAVLALAAVTSASAQLDYATPYEFTVFAGAINVTGTLDGRGSAARFNRPAGLTIDTAGNLYVADTDNHTVRKITPAGDVTTLAGKAQNPGTGDGVGTAAQFYRPEGLAVDIFQNIYVTDTWNHMIRRIATYAGSSGLLSWGPLQVARLAGNPALGVFQDGPLQTATFYLPRSIAVVGGNAGLGGYLLQTEHAPIIRRITPAMPLSQFAPELGTITRHAAASGSPGAIDGMASAVRIQNSPAIASDATGRAWIADQYNHAVRSVAANGAIYTVAGFLSVRGAVDGTGDAARFYLPLGLAASSAGDVLYVADSGNGLIRRVMANGVTTTLGGSTSNPGPREGKGSEAGFGIAAAIAVDTAGNVYVADSSASVIWKGVRADLTPVFPNTPRILRPPVSQTVERRDSVEFRVEAARSPTGTTTYQWNYDGGPIPGARDFFHVIQLAEPADAGAYTVTVTTDGGRVTSRPALLTVVPSTIRYGPRLRVATYAGGTSGSNDGPVATARFRNPAAVAFDRNRNLYVVDSSLPVVRKVSPDGVVTTLAGLATSIGEYADGVGSAARFATLTGVAVDDNGNVFVSDASGDTIRKITPAGVVSTFAGSPRRSGAVDGVGSAARFDGPAGLAFDRVGNLYVVDDRSDTLRKITPDGRVTTLAGKAYSGAVDSSTDGAGSAGHFYRPSGVAVDSSGTIYVADTGNHTIRRVTADGVVSTLAGLARNPGKADGTGAEARFRAPISVALDVAGNLYVSDQGNNTIRRVTRNGVVTTVAGLRDTVGNEDGIGSAARFRSPTGLAVDVAGDGALIIAELGNSTIRRGTPVLGDEPGPTITAAPASLAALPGNRAVFSVQASSSTRVSYQWFRDGNALGGATAATLTIENVNTGHAGTYHVVVTNLFGSTASAGAVLTVGPPEGRISNLSILAGLTATERSFKIGTVVGGRGTRGTKPLVIRAVGPSLSAFGLDGVVADPQLIVAAGSSAEAQIVATNDNWGGDAVLRAAMNRVGAFEFSGPGSLDAAVAPSLPAGDFVIEVRAAAGGAGRVLAELYDATPGDSFTADTPRLVNVSLLKTLGEGIVAGFVIGGDGPRTVLVRAVGPGLSPFGLDGILPNPRLGLFDQTAQSVIENDDWGGTAGLKTAFGQVGAFPLESESRDAALVARLNPGSYTVAVNGASGQNGLVLVEIYEVPPAP